MSKRSRYSRELRERAVWMVLEHEAEYGSQWATIRSIADKIGCSPGRLRKASAFFAQAELDRRAKWAKCGGASTQPGSSQPERTVGDGLHS